MCRGVGPILAALSPNARQYACELTWHWASLDQGAEARDELGMPPAALPVLLRMRGQASQRVDQDQCQSGVDGRSMAGRDPREFANENPRLGRYRPGDLLGQWRNSR